MNIVHHPTIEKLWGRRYWSREEQRALATKAREELLASCAEAWCIRGPQVHKDTELMRPWYPSLLYYPTRGEVDYAGGRKAVIQRIRQSGLTVSGDLRPWTTDFLLGLRLSGAIRRESFRGDGRYQIWLPAHGALVEDMEEATNLPRQLKVYPSTPCVCRLSKCPALWLPPENPKGAEVVAGLIAGAEMRALDGDGEWMLLPDDDGVRGLLDAWTIQHKPVHLPRRKALVAVSPFFASLFCHLMPKRSAERIRSCRNPGDGETLAMLYWAVCFADRGMQLPPFANAIPFAVSPRTFRRREIDRSDLHRVAVCEAGLANLSPGLRELLRRWFAEACADRHADPAGASDQRTVSAELGGGACSVGAGSPTGDGLPSDPPRPPGARPVSSPHGSVEFGALGS